MHSNCMCIECCKQLGLMCACTGPSGSSRRQHVAADRGEPLSRGHLQCRTLLRMAAHTQAAMAKCGAMSGLSRTPRTSRGWAQLSSAQLQSAPCLSLPGNRYDCVQLFVSACAWRLMQSPSWYPDAQFGTAIRWEIFWSPSWKTWCLRSRGENNASAASQHANLCMSCMQTLGMIEGVTAALTFICGLLQLRRRKGKGLARGGGSPRAEAPGAELAGCRAEGSWSWACCRPPHRCPAPCDGPSPAQPGGPLARRGLWRRQLSVRRGQQGFPAQQACGL